jgi:hypothetical protein
MCHLATDLSHVIGVQEIRLNLKKKSIKYHASDGAVDLSEEIWT